MAISGVTIKLKIIKMNKSCINCGTPINNKMCEFMADCIISNTKEYWTCKTIPINKAQKEIDREMLNRFFRLSDHLEQPNTNNNE